MGNRIIWTIAGFIAVAILVALALLVGIYSWNKEDLNSITISLLSLASGIVGATYLSFLYPLYAKGRRLMIYLAVSFIALALTLPVVHAIFFTGGQIDLLIAIFTYYAPGIFALVPFRMRSIPDELRIFLTINISWVVWGLTGLGIGYLREQLLRNV